jgi:hypothetical protein
VGNCAFFEGKPFTYDVDPCRALGNTLEVVYTGGEQVSILNSTFYGHGDGLIYSEPIEPSACDGSETFLVRNSIFMGDEDVFSPGDITFLFYQEGCGSLKLDSNYDVIHRAKNVTCGVNGAYVNSGGQDLCQDPHLSGPFSGNAYGMMPATGSPVIDTGDDGLCPTIDILGVPRPVDGDGDDVAVCDRGAYEWQMLSACGFLPLVISLD